MTTPEAIAWIFIIVTGGFALAVMWVAYLEERRDIAAWRRAMEEAERRQAEKEGRA